MRIQNLNKKEPTILTTQSNAISIIYKEKKNIKFTFNRIWQRYDKNVKKFKEIVTSFNKLNKQIIKPIKWINSFFFVEYQIVESFGVGSINCHVLVNRPFIQSVIWICLLEINECVLCKNGISIQRPRAHALVFKIFRWGISELKVPLTVAVDRLLIICGWEMCVRTKIMFSLF